MSLEFFQILFGDSRGHVPVVTFFEDERNSGKPWKDMQLNKYTWFQWPEQAEALVEFCHAHRTEDCYTTVGVCSRESNKKDAMLPLNVLHCEADNADPAQFPVEPSAVVTSSPGRYQLYWALKEAVDPAKAEWLTKRIAYSQRAAGADYGWAANKLLRIPGTSNTKPEYRLTRKAKPPVVQFRNTGRIYTFKEIKKVFKDVDLGVHTPHVQEIPKVLPPLSEVLSKVPAHALEMYNEAPEATDWNPKGSWYLVLHKLACSLFRAGLEPAEVFVVLANSKANKYERDGRSNEELWPGIWKAQDDVDDTRVVFVDDDDADGNPIQVEVVVGPRADLLTPAERALIEPTWIDKWVAWAKTSTDADPRYHVVSAMALLSTVLSQFAYAYPRNNSMGLEMWFMTLGATTLSRKTTAASYMIRALDRCGENRVTPWQVAMDQTPESLNVELAERGEASSIWHVDEAHGMIADSKGAKGYMHGMIRLLTQLYDGWVPARSRVMSKATKKTPTHLTLHLMGVPSKMVDSLTLDDFHSGFLARFIFVLGSAVQLEPSKMRIKQGNPKYGRDNDPVFNGLTDDLQFMESFWNTEARKVTGDMYPMMFEDDAWERWNDMQVQLTMMAKESVDIDAVMPTASRTSMAVIKLACLLAMAAEKHKVRMIDVLTAIQYAEEWFDTSVMLASLVTKSKFERQVDDIVNSIGPVKRSVSSVYKNYQQFNFKDFHVMLESAEAAGRILLKPEARKNGLIEMVQVLDA